jgi:DNA-binding transcriptional LysR family regulator
VQPRLKILETEEALDELVVDRLDVALVIASDLSPTPARDGVTMDEVYDDPMLVALSSSHPLARQAAVELDALRDDPWLLTAVGGTCEDSNIVRRACFDAGFEPTVQIESEDYQALLGLTASGMGVTVIPSLAALSVPRDVVVRPVAGRRPARRILAAVRAGTPIPR